ncbi:hypothetical protein CRE_12481 [Caenorhabditis remanei]|uniref:Uncharacterized protein n=1 Tax=Caenorhabditis remanei TaxID=31234 RepID=E3M748_CAERE|nr:hypothetical protein CRE_12481 [Caenorhabditis remanei]
MGDYQLHQSRNLSVNQTLDEILGITRKTESTSSSSNSNSIEKNALNSPIRPPTRHGRESAGSNEENKDPVQTENTGNLQPFSFLTSTSTSTTPTGSSRRHSDDDFIKKLNDIRRRSLISTIDMPSMSSTNSFVSSIPIHPDSPKRETRPRLEIHVEESTEEIPPSATQTPVKHINFSETTLGTSSEQEDPSLTFRIDLNEEEELKKEPKEEIQRPKSGKKKEQKSEVDDQKEKPRTPGNEKKESDMMQMSMFHSKVNRTSDAHHKEWLQKKEKQIKERKAKEKAMAEQKEAAEKERRENSKKLYQRWVQDHDEKVKAMKKAKLQKEKEKLEKEKSSKDQKLKEADKNYEMWKRERSKSVTDIKKKLEQESEKKRKAEEDARNEKIKEAKAAFLAWKAKKEEFLSEEARKLRKEEKEKLEEEKKEIELKRLELANEAYETWIQLKESEREMFADCVLIEAPPIPWIPPSNLVPRQFLRSANGSRQRTRSQSAKSVAKRSRSRPATTTSLRPFR